MNVLNIGERIFFVIIIMVYYSGAGLVKHCVSLYVSCFSGKTEVVQISILIVQFHTNCMLNIGKRKNPKFEVGRVGTIHVYNIIHALHCSKYITV